MNVFSLKVVERWPGEFFLEDEHGAIAVGASEEAAEALLAVINHSVYALGKIRKAKSLSACREIAKERLIAISRADWRAAAKGSIPPGMRYQDGKKIARSGL